MNFELPVSSRPTFSLWPMALHNSSAAESESSPKEEIDVEITSSEGKDDSFESSLKVTPDSSFNNNNNHLELLTPPSKCAMQRVPRVTTNSSASSSDTIKDQLKLRSAAASKLHGTGTGNESQLYVRDLVFKTSHEEPLFSSRLIHEFKENYDIPVSEEEAIRLDAEHILLSTPHWKYQSSIGSKAKRGGSPNTASTAPPSFSFDEASASSNLRDDEEKEGDISAITTDQEHYVALKDENSHEHSLESAPSPFVSQPSSAAPKTHNSNKGNRLDGLRQLLWPEPVATTTATEQQDLDDDCEEYDTFDQYSSSGTYYSTSTLTFLQHVTCCAGMLMTGASSSASSSRKAGFASRSEEDTHLIMDTSVGSFLYLDEEEEEDFYEEGDAEEEDFRSVFDSPELGTSVKQMARLALAANCSNPSFDAEEDGLMPAVETSFLSNDGSTLQSAVNLHFLTAQKTPDAPAREDSALNRSGVSSNASVELLNDFYTLDESSCDDQTESAVSEASMVTTPTRNRCADDTMSTRSAFTHEEEQYDEDENEPPSLRLTSRSRSIASYEAHRFLC